MRALLLIALAALAGCASDADFSAPLSGTRIRSYLVGRTFTGLYGNQRFFITFDPNGSATYYGADAQYLHWHANDQGLCIRWYDQPGESCAPVYFLGYRGYRVGGMEIRELDIPHRF